MLLAGERLSWAALALFAAPLLAINAALLISILHETVPVCFPYWDGRISVSRAGRNPPASYLFKSVIVPCGVLGFFYWLAVARRMASLAGRATPTKRESVMAWLGAGGAALLIIYAFALGNPGDLYRFMRRVGVYAYFIGVTFAQILFVLNLRALNREKQLNIAAPIACLWACVAAMLALGILGLPVLYWASGSKSVAERTVEWNYLIPMHLFFLGSFFIWRKITAEQPDRQRK